MKPIRKDEQEYLRTYIGRKFDNRRSALESERQVDVDQEVDKNLSKFRKMLNIEKLIKDVQKASDEYERFCY
jgi:disulfide oxidoreductase YuzD